MESFSMLTGLYRSHTARPYWALVSGAATCGPSAPRFNSVLTACHSNRSALSMAARTIFITSSGVSHNYQEDGTINNQVQNLL